MVPPKLPTTDGSVLFWKVTEIVAAVPTLPA